jgi:transposase
MLEFLSQIEPCTVGMEARGSAHYWAHELKALGHKALLIPPAYLKPYVKRGKNDAADAAAICEAMARPGMRFVPGTLCRDDGRQQTFRIVGEDEADPSQGLCRMFRRSFGL